MDKIDLKLSDSARELLTKHIASSDIDDPITTVVWWEEGLLTSPEGKESKLPPGWGVGWHEPSKVPIESIQYIDGFKYVFDQGAVSEKLNGKLLDVKNGIFVVT